MSEVADRVVVSRSALTRVVDRLAKRGLVARYAGEADGPGLLAEITEQGRATPLAATPHWPALSSIGWNAPLSIESG